MDSIERLIRAAPLPPSLPNNGQGHRRALVHASLATAVGRKGRHLTGTFCLTGDTMEGIIQCLVFLKAFSVSFLSWIFHRNIFAFFSFFLNKSNTENMYLVYHRFWNMPDENEIQLNENVIVQFGFWFSIRFIKNRGFRGDQFHEFQKMNIQTFPSRHRRRVIAPSPSGPGESACIIYILIWFLNIGAMRIEILCDQFQHFKLIPQHFWKSFGGNACVRVPDMNKRKSNRVEHNLYANSWGTTSVSEILHC